MYADKLRDFGVAYFDCEHLQNEMRYKKYIKVTSVNIFSRSVVGL